MQEFFEIIMLVCFGFSWPFNLIKNIKAKTAKSTSLTFILLILTGYVCGIIAKLLSGKLSYSFVFYIINTIIVGANLVVYFINRNHDLREQQKISQ
ncbi:MAG: hypothetical protein IJM79_00820 [Erysipelotrichaceae bacterium]|nr:hypothetical protein [Erysipelotrichaceae bacterium]